MKKTPEDYGITNYTWNEDGSLSVKGDVNLHRENLKKLPYKFKEVGGDFTCFFNDLTSLKGAPIKVGGFFDCSYNKLTSLKGAPQSVGEHFYCYNNTLTSLKGAPIKVGGQFNCSHNKLTSLKGAPCVSRIICSHNPGEFTEREIKAAMNPSNTIPFIKSLEREFLRGNK